MNKSNDDDLGYIEYCGEIIPITWNDYISIVWQKNKQIEIIKVPKRKQPDAPTSDLK